MLLGRNVVNLSKEECQRYFGELGNVVYVLMEKMQQKSAGKLLPLKNAMDISNTFWSRIVG